MVLYEIFIKSQVNKQKPRLKSMYKKADWEGFENHMLSFQNSLLASHEGKSVNLLWEEIKGALQSGIEKYVPQRTVSTKSSLPWMTQEIKRNIRKRDSLYDKYKRLRRPSDRYAFVDARHLVKQELKQAHNRYIEDILSLTETPEQVEPHNQSSSETHKGTYAYRRTGVQPLYVPFSKKETPALLQTIGLFH